MWVKLDDQFPRHPKVSRLSDAAFRLHVEAMCYAAQWLTGGSVPSSVVGRRSRAAVSLERAGLWERDQNGNGWRIHDWADWNPSADDVLKRRARDRERLRRWREGNGV